MHILKKQKEKSVKSAQSQPCRGELKAYISAVLISSQIIWTGKLKVK